MNTIYDDLNRLKHGYHLSLFLNSTDSELPGLLKLEEEYNGIDGFNVADHSVSILGSFHPESVRMVIKDDDNYLGCRANHFILIFGRAEVFADIGGFWGDCVVCIANHKGGLQILVYSFIDAGSACV